MDGGISLNSFLDVVILVSTVMMTSTGIAVPLSNVPL